MPEKPGIVLPGAGDQIRVVPLYQPEDPSTPTADAPPLGPPHLTYRGGPLIPSVQVFVIYWGSAWASTLKPLAAKVDGFFDHILISPLMDQLVEYNVAGMTIGHGKRTGSIVVTAPAPSKVVSDTAIRNMLQHQIATNPAVPHPTANTLYFVYTPPGVAVNMGGGSSCKAFCGYHNAISHHTFYAVMPYPGCTGCTGSLPAFDALTSTSSHELCEALTDAVPGLGWYDDTHGEIGDICAWKTKKVGAYTVQLEWSNAANRCI